MIGILQLLVGVLILVSFAMVVAVPVIFLQLLNPLE